MANTPTLDAQPEVPATEQKVQDGVKQEAQSAPPVTQTPEELEWSKLRGSAQDRFRHLIRERNEYREKASTPMVVAPVVPQTMDAGSYQYPQSGEIEMTPEQREAIDNLRKFGIVTKDDLQAIKDQSVLDNEYARLEAMYSGARGEPMFDRVEVEDHMRKTGIYNPEKAFEDLYRDELYDQRARGSAPATQEPYSARPSVSTASRTEPLTIDNLRARLREPDGQVWWEKNRERILPLMSQLVNG
jgi:hypothetical protein